MPGFADLLRAAIDRLSGSKPKTQPAPMPMALTVQESLAPKAQYESPKDPAEEMAKRYVGRPIEKALGGGYAQDQRAQKGEAAMARVRGSVEGNQPLVKANNYILEKGIQPLIPRVQKLVDAAVKATGGKPKNDYEL